MSDREEEDSEVEAEDRERREGGEHARWSISGVGGGVWSLTGQWSGRGRGGGQRKTRRRCKRRRCTGDEKENPEKNEVKRVRT
jgi:hypothetical protein